MIFVCPCKTDVDTPYMFIYFIDVANGVSYIKGTLLHLWMKQKYYYCAVKVHMEVVDSVDCSFHMTMLCMLRMHCREKIVYCHCIAVLVFYCFAKCTLYFPHLLNLEIRHCKCWKEGRKYKTLTYFSPVCPFLFVKRSYTSKF